MFVLSTALKLMRLRFALEDHDDALANPCTMPIHRSRICSVQWHRHVNGRIHEPCGREYAPVRPLYSR